MCLIEHIPVLKYTLRDSNPGPPDSESVALPTELRVHFSFAGAKVSTFLKPANSLPVFFFNKSFRRTLWPGPTENALYNKVYSSILTPAGKQSRRERTLPIYGLPKKQTRQIQPSQAPISPLTSLHIRARERPYPQPRAFIFAVLPSPSLRGKRNGIQLRLHHERIDKMI